MADSKRHPRIADAVWRDREETRKIAARHPPISKEVFDRTLDKCVKKEQKRIAAGSRAMTMKIPQSQEELKKKVDNLYKKIRELVRKRDALWGANKAGSQKCKQIEKEIENLLFKIEALQKFCKKKHLDPQTHDGYFRCDDCGYLFDNSPPKHF